MNKILFTLIFAVLAAPAAGVFAQEIPADVKAKIVAASKERKNLSSEEKRQAWVVRQTEAWESINSTTFTLPKADIEKIKAQAQKKFPWWFSKQEPFINEQVEALTEIYELKPNFDAAEFEALVADLSAKKDGNYRAVADELAKTMDAQKDIKDFTVDGMDPTLLAIFKKGLPRQFPNDYAKQLEALKKLVPMMELVQQAQADKEAKEAAPKEKTITRTEAVKKAEDMFKKCTLIVSGNGKTGTGIVLKIKDQNALMFPAQLYSREGLNASNSAGEEAAISLKKVFSARNMPLMLVFLEDIPFEVKPVEFATNDELRGSLGKNMIVTGYYVESLRPMMMKLTKVVRDSVKMASPILSSYYEGSLIINPEINKPVAICLKPDKELPEFDFRSNRLLSQFERAMEKESRFLNAFRADIPINWEAVDNEKMEKQMEMAKFFKDTNIALSALISGSLEDAEHRAETAAIASRFKKTLEIRMDISKLRVEYRAFITSLVNMIRRPLQQVKLNEVYANLKSDLGFQLGYTKMIEEELKKELSKNSQTLAPKEFRDRFSKAK